MEDKELIVYFWDRAGGRVGFGRLRLWLFASQPPQRLKLFVAETDEATACRLPPCDMP